jgi:hypothetical protein
MDAAIVNDPVEKLLADRDRKRPAGVVKSYAP